MYRYEEVHLEYLNISFCAIMEISNLIVVDDYITLTSWGG